MRGWFYGEPLLSNYNFYTPANERLTDTELQQKLQQFAAPKLAHLHSE